MPHCSMRFWLFFVTLTQGHLKKLHSICHLSNLSEDLCIRLSYASSESYMLI